MKYNKIFSYILFSILLSGCTGTTQYVPISTIEITPNKAKICLFRKDSISGAANPTNVWEGEELVASIGPGGYVFWEREPGVVKLRVRKAGQAMIKISKYFEIEAKGGVIYFIMAEPIPFGPYKLRLLDQKMGISLLKEYKKPTFSNVK